MTSWDYELARRQLVPEADGAPAGMMVHRPPSNYHTVVPAAGGFVPLGGPSHLPQPTQAPPPHAPQATSAPEFPNRPAAGASWPPVTPAAPPADELPAFSWGRVQRKTDEEIQRDYDAAQVRLGQTNESPPPPFPLRCRAVAMAETRVATLIAGTTRKVQGPDRRCTPVCPANAPVSCS